MYNGIFKGVDSENTAYWLGFLAADGSVREDRNQLILGLSKQDKAHIEKLKQFIGADADIKDRDMLCSTNGKYYPSSLICICDKQLVSDLCQYGIVQDKSHKNINFLQYIPEQYKMYFILGYFDGDGYYILTEKSHGFGWCGCEENISAITNYIKQYLKLTTNAVCRAYKRSPTTYAFTDPKIEDIRLFCKFYLEQLDIVDLLDRKVRRAKQLLEFVISKVNIFSSKNDQEYKEPKKYKKFPKKVSICQICSKTFYTLNKNTGKYCSQECAHIAQQRAERPSRDKLKQLIRNTPFLQIGKQFNVTDNAIRKWCKSLNLPYKTSDIKQYSDKEWELI